MRTYWLFGALVLVALLGALHIYGTVHFFYWKYDNFDILMHLLGGAAMGVIAIALFGPEWSPWRYLALATFASVGWEVFETTTGIAVFPGVNYAWDTAHDLLNDAVGAALVYVIARFTVWRSA
jgi:hypothetical protein